MTVPRYAGHIFNPGQFSMKIPGQISVEINTPKVDTERLMLSINQAIGVDLEGVLESRRRLAADTNSLESLVPLGGLLADLEEFENADQIYRQALSNYQDVSPFAAAWVCFQLGALWGEQVPDPDAEQAAKWYEQAIAYLPPYVKARVHLSEIYTVNGRTSEAEGLLRPVIDSGDPEASWRLANTLMVTGCTTDGKMYLAAARSGFETLLDKYPLAFADHGAEFYSGSGNNPAKALELSMLDVKNRPTLKGFKQTYLAAMAAYEPLIASTILNEASERWGASTAAAIQSQWVC